MIFLMASSWPTMLDTNSDVAVGVSEILKSMVSSSSKVASRSLARSLRQSAAGHGMERASGSILKFCNSSRDWVSRPMASICSMGIMLALNAGMMVVCGGAAAWEDSLWGSGFASSRSEERFSLEKARRRICSTSSSPKPRSRARPPIWKEVSIKVQPSSMAASAALYSSLFRSLSSNLPFRNWLTIFLALSILSPS